VYKQSLLILALTLPAFCQTCSSQNLRVAAAADLSPVLPPILSEFQVKTGQHVDASFQSSATLAAQIENGAPFDLFLSADMSFPRRVIAAGVADSLDPVPYARGTLVLWMRKDSRFPSLSLDTLREPSLKSVAIANPQHAPYGTAAVASLTHLGIYDALKPKFVIAENIAQAAQYADSGNADVGLLSLTSALSDRLVATGRYMVMPRDSYPAIIQGAIVIKTSGRRETAHQLLDFLLSAPVQKQLLAHGLEPPS
jgi:molybdate transport system substrate-binding protein